MNNKKVKNYYQDYNFLKIQFNKKLLKLLNYKD